MCLQCDCVGAFSDDVFTQIVFHNEYTTEMFLLACLFWCLGDHENTQKAFAVVWIIKYQQNVLCVETF